MRAGLSPRDVAMAARERHRCLPPIPGGTRELVWQFLGEWRRHAVLQRIPIPLSSSTSTSCPWCEDPTALPELLSKLWWSLRSPRKVFQVCTQLCLGYCLLLLFAKSHRESGSSQIYSALTFSLYGHSSQAS